MLTERIAEWWAERWVKKSLSKLDPKDISDADLSRLEDPNNGIISSRADGFVVQTGAFSAELTWSGVSKVFSYKRDLFSTDLICMGFARRGDEAVVETHEEMAGFLKLRQEAEHRFPGLSEAFNGWLLNSLAFDTAVVCIWERPQA